MNLENTGESQTDLGVEEEKEDRHSEAVVGVAVIQEVKARPKKKTKQNREQIRYRYSYRNNSSVTTLICDWRRTITALWRESEHRNPVVGPVRNRTCYLKRQRPEDLTKKVRVRGEEDSDHETVFVNYLSDV